MHQVSLHPIHQVAYRANRRVTPHPMALVLHLVLRLVKARVLLSTHPVCPPMRQAAVHTQAWPHLMSHPIRQAPYLPMYQSAHHL